MPPRKKKPADSARGLTAAEVLSPSPPGDVAALARQVFADGGAALATYREPFGGHWVVLAALPLEKVSPTPYQRELSETHADRLAGVIEKVGLYLDPVIAVRHDDAYWTPNGMHRLAALRRLGARSVVALLVPDPRIAYRILALNTEKAHNLKDRALEVVRMARGLAASPATRGRPESDWAFEFEEPAYLDLGLAYEQRPRYSGSAYLPIVKRCEAFLDLPIARALERREPRRDKLLELDDAVAEVVEALKASGLRSAYLKPFVVARINPLRFVRPARPGQPAPRAELDATLDKMLAAARRFDPSKVRPQDLATMAGAAPVEE